MFNAPHGLVIGDSAVRQRAGIDPPPRQPLLPARATSWHPGKERALQEINECDQQFTQLMGNVALRHPNPGAYKFREGNVGASWRHIREVLCYGGNRICYIDGKVRLYDETGLNEAFTHGSLGVKRRYEPKSYAPVHTQLSPQRYASDLPSYKPWQSVVEMPEKLPPIGVIGRPGGPTGKVKGHYVY